MGEPRRAVAQGPDECEAIEDISEDVIDLAHLELHTFNDRALRDELLGIFGQQLDEYVGLLEQASAHDQWIAAAHTLKGSARAIGAGNLASHCEAMESLVVEDWRAGQAGAVQGLKAHIRALRSAITAITASQ